MSHLPGEPDVPLALQEKLYTAEKKRGADVVRSQTACFSFFIKNERTYRISLRHSLLSAMLYLSSESLVRQCQLTRSTHTLFLSPLTHFNLTSERKIPQWDPLKRNANQKLQSINVVNG
jgi:hypothetical protein